MSAQGRAGGEYRSAQHDDSAVSAAAGPLVAVQATLHGYLRGLSSDIPEALRSELHARGPFTLEERLGVYRHGYRARLLEVLQDDFEKSWSCLGDAAFAAAVAGFIDDHPPQHRNLRWFGDGFAEWLGTQYPADPEVGELAQLEWRLRGAFDGADSEPLAGGALSALHGTDWASAGCRFVRTFDLVPVRCNAVAIWQALEQQQTPPMAAALPEQTWVLIWRKGWQSQFRTIGADEYQALIELRAGASFAAVCASLGVGMGETQAAVLFASWLRTWLDDELIKELTGLHGE